MEENMNATEQITQAENMGNETGTQAAGKEKLFTQDEVNSFVQSRISRLKGQIQKDAKAEYDQKLADLNAREMKLLVKEKLSARDMPKELADIISGNDETEIDAKLDALQRIYGNSSTKKEEKSTGFIQIGADGSGSNDGSFNMSSADPVARAMGLG